MLSSKLFYKTVIASAAADCSLRADFCGDELKNSLSDELVDQYRAKYSLKKAEKDPAQAAATVAAMG